MKLVTFSLPQSPETLRSGALMDGERVLDLTDRHGQMLDMLALNDHDKTALQQHVARSTDADEIHRLSDVRLLAPVPAPNSIRDCMEFEAHLVGSMRTVVRRRFAPLVWLDSTLRSIGTPILRVPRVWHERPLYYKGNRRSVVGTECDVIWPTASNELDFELELGVFVSKTGKNLTIDEASSFIGGYCLFNDFSARDIQLREMQGRLGPAKGKDFDTGNAIGPHIVTPDEVDERSLECEVRVNGEVWSRCSTDSMKFTFAELLSFISQDETLYPGDFVASGTLPGGCGLELDRWIQPNDTIELDGGILGVLRNRVVRETS